MGRPANNLARAIENGIVRVPWSGCWLWFGAEGSGYGRVGFKGNLLLTHRVSWELTNGPIPDGLWVLHKCDVRCCVNPDHLFLGTPKDNMQDKLRKGRGNGAKKITAAIVLQIRAATGTHREIGKRFGLSHATTGKIIRRLLWKHVP